MHQFRRPAIGIMAKAKKGTGGGPTAKSQKRSKMPPSKTTLENEIEENLQHPLRNDPPDHAKGVPGGSSGGSDGSQKVPTALTKLWRHEGRCLRCGAESHRRAECPIINTRKPPAGEHTEAEGCVEDAKKDKKSKKRRRSTATPSGLTPQAKRHVGDTAATRKEKTSPKYSFAEASLTALTLGILDTKGEHITKKTFIRLQTQLTEEYIKAIDDGVWAPEYEAWGYTSSYAKVSLRDQRSLEHVKMRIEELGLKTIDFVTARNKPVFILSGFARGAAACCDKARWVKFVGRAAELLAIQGRCDVLSVKITKNSNCIIRLQVDGGALSALQANRMELRLGTAGRVKFTQIKPRPGGAGLAELCQKRIDLLEAELTKEKEVLHRLRSAEEERFSTDAESVKASQNSTSDEARAVQELFSGDASDM